MNNKKRLMNFSIPVRTHSILKEACDRNSISMTSIINKMILEFIAEEKGSPVHSDEPLDFFILR